MKPKSSVAKGKVRQQVKDMCCESPAPVLSIQQILTLPGSLLDQGDQNTRDGVRACYEHLLEPAAGAFSVNPLIMVQKRADIATHFVVEVGDDHRQALLAGQALAKTLARLLGLIGRVRAVETDTILLRSMGFTQAHRLSPYLWYTGQSITAYAERF